MSVLIEAISVVVPVPVLKQKIPGGFPGYIRGCPNQTFCHDGNLTRVGFMHSDDVERFVARLERSGLRRNADGEAADIAVVDQLTGCELPCRWLKLGCHVEGFQFAARVDDDCLDVAIPNGWEFEGSISQSPSWTPLADEASLPLVETRGQMEVRLNLATGQQVFVGRTSSPSKKPAGRPKPRGRMGRHLARVLKFFGHRNPGGNSRSSSSAN